MVRLTAEFMMTIMIVQGGPKIGTCLITSSNIDQFSLFFTVRIGNKFVIIYH